ncbi:hypothetical protein D7I44_08300 [Gryllotalpicola protaetiae]|uniref:2-oxoglutarate dehydrogenase n=1 Tax=Gryllotalpicola protaetiae TaxID=2419771 RepID=A0A387BND3_9MICO|nr:hypothetical protein D7I44_08300 [Gryllotalpicola protaetiae]
MSLLIAAALLLTSAAVAVPLAPANAAHRDTAAGAPVVEVYAAGGGIVPDGGDLQVSVVIANPSTEPVDPGQVSVSVGANAIATPAALADFQQDPQKAPLRALGTGVTTAVPAGGTLVVAQLTIPAASVDLPSSAPGVFGLAATVATPEGEVGTGAGTLIVPGAAPATVGVAAVMSLTAPVGATGLVSAQDLATYTAADGVLTRELGVAQHNPALTVGIDPMLLVSIRVLGQSAPASAQAWFVALTHLANPTFALQYGDADPAVQTQAGLAAPLQPSDFTYAMSAGDFNNAPLTVGEPTATAQTAAPTPTPSPTAGPQLPPLSELIGFPYKIDGVAWPAPGTVSGSDTAALAAAGLTTTIVSSANTNATKLGVTPDAALTTSGGSALVTDDAVSQALQAAATASDPTTATLTTAALYAQLALAAQNAPQGGVVLASLDRSLPTDVTYASAAVATVLGSAFTRPASLQDAQASAPTAGLALVDQRNAEDRIQRVQALLDLAGEPRTGGTADAVNIASFSSVLSNPVLLTGDVRARLLQLFSVGWVGSNAWNTAVSKQLSAMHANVTGVQIMAPESIRQASRQALIPITVTNKLTHPVDVVLRATPSSARLEVESDTVKTIAAGSSAKVLVPVRAQLSNGTVRLHLQLYSKTDVPIGDSHNAELDVHADWEGIGAIVFGVIVVGFFGFGLFRTIQRRRREKGEAKTEPDGDAGEATTDAAADGSAHEAPRG